MKPGGAPTFVNLTPMHENIKMTHSDPNTDHAKMHVQTQDTIAQLRHERWSKSQTEG